MFELKIIGGFPTSRGIRKCHHFQRFRL